MELSGDEPVYVISVAAQLAGLPSWMLRVLDQEGIVCPTRTSSNRRLYSQNDITLLAHIKHLTVEREVNMAGVKVILEMERNLKAQQAAEIPLPAPEDAALPEPEPVPAPKSAGPRAAAANPMEELALAVPEVTDIVS